MNPDGKPTESNSPERKPPDSNPQAIDTSRTFVPGLSHTHPAQMMQFDEHGDQVDDWDRCVLLGGGVIFGFSLGITTALAMFASRPDASSLVAICAGFVSSTLLVVAAALVKTQRLLKQAQILNQAQASIDSVALTQHQSVPSEHAKLDVTQ